MSILIKGMEMPKKGVCYAVITFDGDSIGVRIPPSKEPFFSGRIVHIPTPHGRLIDADAVEERLQKYWYEEYPNQEASYHRAFMDSNACVKDLPTIIEAEVSE